MISSPALLYWFLEHQPLTFPADSVLALWFLSSNYMKLAQRGWSTNAAEAVLILQMTTASSSYFQHLAKPTVTSRLHCSVLSRLLEIIASCQANILMRISQMVAQAPGDVWGQALQDVLHAPAVHDVAMLQLAGACHCSYRLWSEQHAKDAAKGTSSNSAKYKGKSSSTSSSSTRGKSSSSSKASKAAGGTAAPGLGCVSSFQELSVAPDHNIVAVADGHAAIVAAYAKVAKLHADLKDPHAGPLLTMRGAVQVMSAGATTGNSSRPSSADLQLLLESVILVGIGEEVTKSPPKLMQPALNALIRHLHLAKVADRRVFVAARGALLLQLLGVVLRGLADEEQQQQWAMPPAVVQGVRSTTLLLLNGCVSAEKDAPQGQHG